MENTPAPQKMKNCTGLDLQNISLAQAIDTWTIRRDSKQLERWLQSHPTKAGGIELITPLKMEDFMKGVLACSAESRSSYYPPSDWPTESFEETQLYRDALMRIPEFYNNIESDESHTVSIAQLMYQTHSYKQAMIGNLYSPSIEYMRLSCGMKPNKDWWMLIPLRQNDMDEISTTRWQSVLPILLQQNMEQQGLILAIAIHFLWRVEHRYTDNDLFKNPKPLEVLSTPIKDKEILALWCAWNCDRADVPSPTWWQEWDLYCKDKPEKAEYAITVLLALRVGLQPHYDCDATIRSALIRLASLREPPENYSMLNVMATRKKYKERNLNDLLDIILPINTPGLRFYEPLGSYSDQLMLHYHRLDYAPDDSWNIPFELD